MRPGSPNLDLSAREPSENQNSPAETGRQAGGRHDQCLGPGAKGEFKGQVRGCQLQVQTGGFERKDGGVEGG